MSRETIKTALKSSIELLKACVTSANRGQEPFTALSDRGMRRREGRGEEGGLVPAEAIQTDDETL